MATVSGYVLFDKFRTAAPPGGMSGIANVAVVLQNMATNVMLAVYTDANGRYYFVNVPNGNYRIVEAYGTNAVTSPGDFNNATVGAIPPGVVPPLDYCVSPPPDATDLDCTVPNTVFIAVSGTDLLCPYILNGPVRYIPIDFLLDYCAVVSPANLLTDAYSGTMGAFPQGTPANTGAPSEPFPGNVPDFKYVMPMPAPGHEPEDGEYTVQNIMNNDNSNVIGAWWRIADRTTGNETGRMMVVNGYQPGAIFFRSQVSVKPDTNYLFSTWILNLFKALGWANPALGVEVLDENGGILFSQTLGALIPVNVNEPEWRQIGTVINSRNNTTLTFNFLSEGPDAIGNDYAIDDIALQEIQTPVFRPRKAADSLRVSLGETVTYTVTLENVCNQPLTDVFFQDPIPDGLSFVAGSVTVNGGPMPGADPEIGFSVPDIAGGNMSTITFEVRAEFVPDINPTINMAQMSYDYMPIPDGMPERYNVETNTVPLLIYPPWCRIMSVAVQRERNLEGAIKSGDILTFDRALVSAAEIEYQQNGNIDILRRGIYIIFWFAVGMTGFSTDGQRYELKKFNYETLYPDDPVWTKLVGASNHIKVSSTSGFGVITVSGEEISKNGKATIALFNAADSAIHFTFFQPKAGIMIFGIDSECLDERISTILHELDFVESQLQQLKSFLYTSEVVQLWSPTPELSGLGAAVIHIGFNYNFWGIGELDSQQTLNNREVYYLIRSSQYPPLTLYQGESTIGALWVEEPSGAATQYPLRFDETGIYFIPDSTLVLPAGTLFSFTRQLILA